MLTSALAISFVVTFWVFVAVELLFCFLLKETLRVILKPFCVGFLAFAVVSEIPSLYLVYIGLLLCLIGDTLLIFQKNHFLFLIGSLAFFAAHVCYAAQIIIFMQAEGMVVPWFVYLILGVVFIILDILVYPYAKKSAGKTSLFGNFYLFFILAVLGFSICLTVVLSDKTAGFLLIGAYALFFLSDAILVLCRYKFKQVKRRHFYVMLPYLVAQFLLVSGFLLLGK